MVQPKTPPLSIRPGDERLALIVAYAVERKITRHAAALELIDKGLSDEPLTLKVVPQGPTAWPSGAVILPEHREDPGPGAPLTGYYYSRAATGRADVDFGPMRAKPGERLKGPKPTKGKK